MTLFKGTQDSRKKEVKTCRTAPFYLILSASCFKTKLTGIGRISKSGTEDCGMERRILVVDDDNVMSAIRLGAVNYLKKPFYPRELLRRIAKELG